MATATIRIWDSVNCEGILKEVDEAELVLVPLIHRRSNILQAKLIFDWCAENDVDANLVSGHDPGTGYVQTYYIPDLSHRSFFMLRWS